MKEDKSR